MFQLALPRRERLVKVSYLTTRNNVSTRAPAKGATRHGSRSFSLLCVSTRAPAKGATLLARLELTTLTRFQLALPRRERRVFNYTLGA